MTTTEAADLLGLYTPEIATYKDLSLLIETSAIEENPSGSVLAASLLQLPSVFTQTTAAVLLDAVAFDIHPSEREIREGGSFKSAREILTDRFAMLAEQQEAEKLADPVDLDLLTQVLDFAEEDLDAARELYLATEELRRQEQRALGPIEKIELLLQELRLDSQQPTPGQLVLVSDRDTATVAARAFPNAERLLSALTEQRMTPAEERRAEQARKRDSLLEYAAGNLGVAELNDLQIMLILDEDPEAIASVALNTPNVDRTALLNALEHGSDHLLCRWLFGLEANYPEKGEIENLMRRFTEDRIRTLAAVCQTNLKAWDESNTSAPSVPWIVDVIRHVYVPRLHLDAATAALVWHELSKECGEDPSMWLAVLLSDTSEEPTRLQDIVL